MDNYEATDEMVEYASYISSLFLNQSTSDHPEGETSGRELSKILRQRFFGSICGQIASRDQVIDYLNRQRTYNKISESCDNCDVALFRIRSSKPGLTFEIWYNVSSKFDFIQEVHVNIDADSAFYGTWFIRQVDIGGSCIDSNTNINLTKVRDARWPYLNKTARDFLDGFETNFIDSFNFTERDEKLDIPFEAVIETDPMFTETYNWTEFVHYMLIFHKRYQVTNTTISPHGDSKSVTTVKEPDHFIVRVRKTVQYIPTNTNDLWEFQFEMFHNKDEERYWKISRVYIRPLNVLPNRPIYELTNATVKNFEKIINGKINLDSDLTKNIRIFRTCSYLHTQNTGFSLDIIPKPDVSRKPEINIKLLDADKKYAPHINFQLKYTYYTEKKEKKETEFRFYSEYDYKYDTYNIRDAVQACNQYGEGITFLQK